MHANLFDIGNAALVLRLRSVTANAEPMPLRCPTPLFNQRNNSRMKSRGRMDVTVTAKWTSLLSEKCRYIVFNRGRNGITVKANISNRTLPFAVKNMVFNISKNYSNNNLIIVKHTKRNNTCKRKKIAIFIQ